MISGLQKLEALNFDDETSKPTEKKTNEVKIGKGLQKLIDVGKRIDFVESITSKEQPTKDTGYKPSVSEQELNQYFGDPLTAEGQLNLQQRGLPEEQVDTIYNVAKQNIKPENVLGVLKTEQKPQVNQLSIADIFEIRPSEKYSEKDFAKFNQVMLPGGIKPVGEKPGELLPINPLALISPHRHKKVNELYKESKETEKPENFIQLKDFQKDLDAIEYLNKKYSADGAEYNPDDEKQLKNLINKRNTLTGIHTGLTYGELQDYKLFNAAKKIEELKGKSDYQKDLKNVPQHIYSGVLQALNLTVGSDFEPVVKSDIRKDLTNIGIEDEYKKEVQPHTLFGQVVQGLTTTAALAPVFAFGFAAGGVKQGAGYLKNLVGALKGSAISFAPGGVGRGIQETIKEVNERESNGEQLNVFDRIWIATKNTGGEALKNTMEGVSEMLIPGFSPGKTLLTNILKKSTLGILTETGTEQISDITGDLVDGTNTSLLVSLARTGGFTEEALNQVLVEAIIAGVYGTTIGGGEFWAGHLQDELTPEEYDELQGYIKQNKKKVETNLNNVISESSPELPKTIQETAAQNLPETTAIADPQSRLVVNTVERQIKDLIRRKNRPIDEKIVTSQIENVRDPKEQDRLAEIYNQVLQHNKNIKQPSKSETPGLDKLVNAQIEEGEEDAGRIRSNQRLLPEEGKIEEESQIDSGSDIQQTTPEPAAERLPGSEGEVEEETAIEKTISRITPENLNEGIGAHIDPESGKKATLKLVKDKYNFYLQGQKRPFKTFSDLKEAVTFAYNEKNRGEKLKDETKKRVETEKEEYQKFVESIEVPEINYQESIANFNNDLDKINEPYIESLNQLDEKIKKLKDELKSTKGVGSKETRNKLQQEIENLQAEKNTIDTERTAKY